MIESESLRQLFGELEVVSICFMFWIHEKDGGLSGGFGFKY